MCSIGLGASELFESPEQILTACVACEGESYLLATASLSQEGERLKVSVWDVEEGLVKRGASLTIIPSPTTAVNAPLPDERGEGALSLTQLLWTTRRHSDNDDQRDDSNVLCLLFRHKVFLLSLVFSSSASSSSASLDNERLHVSEDNDGFHGALSPIATLSLMKELSLASSNSLFSAVHLIAPSSSSSLPSLLLIEAPPSSSSSSSLDLSLSNSSPLDSLVFDLKGRMLYDPITTALPVPSSSSFPFDGNGVLAFSRHRSQLVPLFARSRLLTPVNPPQFEGGKEKEEEDNGDDRSAASLGVYCLLNGSLLLSKYCPRTSTLETSHALLPILIEEEGSHSTTPTITSPKHLTSRVNSHLKQVIPFTTATNKTSRSKYACLHFSSVSGVKESKLSLLIFAIKPLPAPSKHEEHESLKPFSSGVKPGIVRRSSVNTPGISPAASSFLSCQLLSSLKIRDNFIFEGNCDDHLSVVSLTELKIKGGVGRNRLLLQDGHHLSFYAFFPATNSITLLLSINIDTVPTPLMPPTNPPKSSSSSSFLPPFLSLSRHKSVSSSDLVHAYLTSSQLLTFAANKTSTRVSIHPLLTSLSSPLLPQADGVLLDLSDKSLLLTALRRPQGSLENVLNHSSLSLSRHVTDRAPLPSALLIDLLPNSPSSTNFYAEITLLVAKSQDREGKHIVCTALNHHPENIVPQRKTRKETAALRKASVWMLNRRTVKWRRTELTLPLSALAFAVPSFLSDGGVSRSSTWDKIRLSSSSSPSAAFSHITTVLSLAWFADHTILLLTLRGKNVYLELVSREKLHELFLLPAELANPTLFDVQIEAITSLLVRTKHLTRSSPTSYSLSLLFIADLAQYTKALPVLTLKLFASTSAVASMPAIALLALDSSGCLYYITPTIGGWASGSKTVKEQQAESLLLLREVEDFHRLEYPHSLGTSSPECLIARRGPKEVIQYLLWSPFFFTISSSFSSCLIHLSSLENGSFSGFRSGILFWNITQKISLSLQSSVEEQSTTFSASHSSSSSSYLPSISFQPLPLSLAFLLFSESLTREDQADSILDAFLARSLDMLLTDNVAAVLFLEEAEKALKDMVSKKNFTNRDPSFQRFIATLARFSPTLMRDVIASTSRRVESSLVRYMFPLPMTSLAPCLSPTALFLSCLQPSPNLTQCARLLTIACEEDEEEEDWKNSSSSIEMSVELLLASMRHLHLPLSVEVLSFIFRLESLTVFNNDKIQRKPKKKSKASSSSGFFASLSSVLLSPLSLFVEEVEEAAETSSTQDPLEAPIKISRYGSSGNDERDEEVKWEEEILERGGEVGNSTFKRILKHLKSASHSSSSSSFSSSSSTACISTYSMALTCSLALSSLCPFSVAVLLSSFCLPSSSISPSARSSLSSLSPSTELLAQPLSYVAEGCRSRLESLLRTPALSLLYFFLSPFESLKATTESRATNQSTLLKTILSKCGFKDGYYSKAELEGMMMSTISETRLRDCCQSELSFDSNSGTMVLLSLPSFQGVRSVNSSGGEKKAALIATSLMDLSLFHTAEDCHVLTVHSLLRSLCMASILSNRLPLAGTIMLLLGRIDLCTALLVLLRQPETARSEPAAMAISYFCCDSDVLLKFTPISLSSSDYGIASSAFLNSLQSKLEDERSENYIDFACFILEALYNEIAMIMSAP